MKVLLWWEVITTPSTVMISPAQQANISLIIKNASTRDAWLPVSWLQTRLLQSMSVGLSSRMGVPCLPQAAEEPPLCRDCCILMREPASSCCVWFALTKDGGMERWMERLRRIWMGG